jgi:cell division protein FtsI (penicillin-binding protein 3)
MERHEPRKFLNSRYWSCRVLFHFLVIAGLCAIVGKAFRLQVIEHSIWVGHANACLNTKFLVPAYRGTIYDRQGRVLSYSVPQRSLYAFGYKIENPAKIAALLSPVLDEPARTIEKKLTSSGHFVWIKRQLTDQQATEIEKLKAPGLNLTDEYKRFYPYRQVGGQVVGFVNIDGAGIEGVEKSFDDVLKGKPIPVSQLRDGGRKRLWLNSSAPPEPAESCGVRLTLDTFIEYVAECELEKAAQKYNARSAEVVVMDAETLEVLAMTSWPFFDPNIIPEKKDPKEELGRNHAISDAYEPGSTFKVFLMSGALDQNLVHENDRIFCENGSFKLASNSIKDVHPHGWITMQEVIKYSSNIGAAKIALHMGSEKYSHYIHEFGFGSLTGIALPGEFKGLVRAPKRWRPIDLATTGFGQSIGVTTLQITNAVAVIANGGQYGGPIIASDILDSQGSSIEQIKSIKTGRVIQKRTADQVRAMMELVTQEGGTGVNAAPEGYRVAGKTGTAQVMDRTTKHYASNKYTSLFTGFVPAERPKLVITVVVHEPQGAGYGGVVAAPVFRDIAAKALPYLGVMPSAPNSAPGPDVRMAKAPSAGLTKASGSNKAPAGKPGDKSAQKTASKKPASKKNSGAVTRDAKKVQPAPKATRRESPEKYSISIAEREARVY